jgi:hypothetical protein
MVRKFSHRLKLSAIRKYYGEPETEEDKKLKEIIIKTRGAPSYIRWIDQVKKGNITLGLSSILSSGENNE